MKTWFSLTKNDADEAEMSIFDEIGAWGVKAKDFCEQLKTVTAKKLTVRINSPGGDFFDGLAIYNAIKEHAAEVTCRVTGIAASAASSIAIAGDKTVIEKNSFLMIHNVWSVAVGDASEMRKQAETLDMMSMSAAKMYASKSGKTVEEMKKAMDNETWYDSDDAKNAGLVDEIIDDDEDEEDYEQKVKNCFAVLNKYPKAPEKLRKFAASMSLKSKKKEAQMPKAFKKPDGKMYVNIAGVDHPIEIDEPATNPAPTPAVVPQNSDQSAEDRGRAKERAYRSEFDAILKASGLTGKEAENFTEKLYGKDLDSVKLVASMSIGNRAKPVGESTEDENKPKNEEKKNADEENAFANQCAEEFAAKCGNGKHRFEIFGVSNHDPKSDEYKNGLAAYIRGCRNNRGKVVVVKNGQVVA